MSRSNDKCCHVHVLSTHDNSLFRCRHALLRQHPHECKAGLQSHAASTSFLACWQAMHNSAGSNSSNGGSQENASGTAVEQACERMILEAVRLLQEGQLEQAEYLLLEGAEQRVKASNTAFCAGCNIAA